MVFNTVVDCLRSRADEVPARIAYTFLFSGQGDEIHLTFADLHDAAVATARRLRSVAQPGDRILLAQSTGPAFLESFFGCLYAGLVAVPVCPPRPNQSLRGIQEVVRDSGASVGIATASLVTRLSSRPSELASLPGFEWLSDDRGLCSTNVSDAKQEKRRTGDFFAKKLLTSFSPVGLCSGSLGGVGARGLRLGNWPPMTASPDTLAYLQYTSGSTGFPKGVMVSHGNLSHNLAMIEAASDPCDAPVYVSWLPLFHDLGLVAVALRALHVGARCVLLPPLHVLQRPLRWLQAITRYRGTTSGAPNFAYDLCSRTISPGERDELDLSSWTAAFNAAEPVRSRTLDRFATMFAPSGFRREAFYPCYGLAEATVFVTGGGQARPVTRRFCATALEQGLVVPLTSASQASGRELVGCGRPWLGLRVLIVDSQTRIRCPVDRVGEIWISGESVAGGYWNRPQETAETFSAYLADDADGPFLRTGDLGFFHEGDLFIVGRMKDLIIVRGSNHYPQDIEATVQRASGALASYAGAAFSLELEGEERLVIVQELRRARESESGGDHIVADIREAVAAEHALRSHAIILLRPGSLPRTTSGKIQRGACREQLRSGMLEAWAADYGDPDCRDG